MNWKQFLKPDWRKIVILFIIIILAVISLIYSIVTLPAGYNNVVIPWTPWSVLSFVLDLIPVVVYYELPSELKIISLFIAIIYWYLLSCLIVWIYDKLKKKK